MISSFHEGELAMQARAGVRDVAERIGRGIRSEIPLIGQRFMRDQPIAIMGSSDAAGRAWASLLVGEPGFLNAADDKTLRIETTAGSGDPLIHNLRACSQAGLLVIDFASRRRMRVNGTVVTAQENLIVVNVEQVYSNCPKYIQSREWAWDQLSTSNVQSVWCGTTLAEHQRRWIREADTFFIASAHPQRGADVSHRGGSAGFVGVHDGTRLEWPDYTGNSMFQTLGNLAVNPAAGLLFVNWPSGGRLQLSGSAKVIWNPERTGQPTGTERRIKFQLEEVIEVSGGLPLRWVFLDYSPSNLRSEDGQHLC